MGIEILSSAAEAIDTQMKIIAENISRSKVPASSPFRSVLADTGYQTVRSSSQNENEKTLPLQKGQGVSIMGTQVLFQQGTLKNTGYEYDLAIHGKGFVELLGNNGNLYYGRLRNLSRDKDGYLSMNGKRLNPPIQVPIDASEFEVNRQGEVHVHIPGQTAKTLLGQIELVDFVNYDGLKMTTWGDYEYTDDAGTMTRGIASLNGFGEINQFKEEQSSINLTNEILTMMDLGRLQGVIMQAVRKYDQAQSAVTSAAGA